MFIVEMLFAKRLTLDRSFYLSIPEFRSCDSVLAALSLLPLNFENVEIRTLREEKDGGNHIIMITVINFHRLRLVLGLI